MRLVGWQFQVLFHALQALFKFCDQNAMANGGGMIFHHRPVQMGDALTQSLFHTPKKIAKRSKLNAAIVRHQRKTMSPAQVRSPPDRWLQPL